MPEDAPGRGSAFDRGDILSRAAAGGWRLAAGGGRRAAGGWRLAAGGWRRAAGGWRREGSGNVGLSWRRSASGVGQWADPELSPAATAPAFGGLPTCDQRLSR